MIPAEAYKWLVEEMTKLSCIVTKGRFCINTESNFADNYITNCKPILLCILKRSHNKSDLVKYFDDVFTRTGILDKQKCCYLLDDLTINPILDEKEISATTFIEKMAKPNHL